MDCETLLTAIGLGFDIVGVSVLFFTTSQRHIEAELSFSLVEGFTSEDDEWTMPYSYEEHKRMLSETEKEIKRNRVFQRLGLGLVTLGFTMQAVGLFV